MGYCCEIFWLSWLMVNSFFLYFWFEIILFCFVFCLLIVIVLFYTGLPLAAYHLTAPLCESRLQFHSCTFGIHRRTTSPRVELNSTLCELPLLAKRHCDRFIGNRCLPLGHPKRQCRALALLHINNITIKAASGKTVAVDIIILLL